ncbi:MAG: DUF4178 domain-containing protein [Patescibacteria group bacterium]
MAHLSIQQRNVFEERLSSIRLIDPHTLIPEQARSGKSIKNVQIGGVLVIGQHAYRVVGRSEYAECDEKFNKKTGDHWEELALFCLDTGDTAYLEFEEDDGIKCWLTINEVRLSDILDRGDSVDTDDLDDLTESDSTLVYDGQQFRYDDDYAALYTSGGKGKQKQGKEVYFYDFVAGKLTLTIEEWGYDGEYDYEAFLSKQIDPREISILSLGWVPDKH